MNIDETILVNKCLPKSWKCPHCGNRDSLSEDESEVFITYMRYLKECRKCGYVHTWELQLTEDFKKDVVAMLKGEL